MLIPICSVLGIAAVIGLFESLEPGITKRIVRAFLPPKLPPS